ncbi:MAG: nitronate monooxygenase [Deltaproteobacteria bacterium]|nr:nitronate monooxygenase [Deltaproteobacteria bacterium]
MRYGKREVLCKLLNIDLPIIQAGMVWVSGAKLAAAAANAGVLGVIGAASMQPDLLRQHLRKAKGLTRKSFAVNVPLLYSKTDQQIEVALEEGVRIFITSAGSPKPYTAKLKDAGCTVLHVISSPLLAKKCEDAGVDIVIAEGFEAGGHNGRDEITTMVLIPEVVKAVKIPVIAAGGIASGGAIAAAFALGAWGAQMGSRFAVTVESSAHPAFKQAIVEAPAGGTMLCMKKLVPVRILKNHFFETVHRMEEAGASVEQLLETLGKGRARRGMFEGDREEGELEIGQISGAIEDIPTVSELVERLKKEYELCIADLKGS